MSPTSATKSSTCRPRKPDDPDFAEKMAAHEQHKKSARRGENAASSRKTSTRSSLQCQSSCFKVALASGADLKVRCGSRERGGGAGRQ